MTSLNSKIVAFGDALLAQVGGQTQAQAHATITCVFCGNPVGEFRDALSKKEYGISGACQACQDVVFAEPSEVDWHQAAFDNDDAFSVMPFIVTRPKEANMFIAVTHQDSDLRKFTVFHRNGVGDTVSGWYVDGTGLSAQVAHDLAWDLVTKAWEGHYARVEVMEDHEAQEFMHD